MALSGENGNGFFMPVAPAYGGGNGFGNGFGGDWAWIILLLLLGWGNNGFGGNGGYGGGNNLYPWMNQANLTSEGFQNQMLNDNITSIRDGINGISTQLCNGFAGVEQGANTRQMANMQTAFDLQSQLANCCCENRLATAQTQSILARESAETRFADANNTRDIIQSQTNGTQAILDKLCALELDAKNTKIADLERQLSMASLAASQTAQTAQITENVYNRLATCPVGTTPVYGNQAIFSCPQNNGCGCGGNSFIN